jgi:hypothetical protein
MFKGLDFFEKISGKTKLNITVIYAGDDDQERSNGSVVSWKRFTF